jgi:hypothetical protein
MIRVIAFALGLGLTASTCADAARPADFKEIKCPDQIAAADVSIARRNDWQPHVDYALPLFGAGMSSGPPESEMQLRGEPLDAKGNATSYEFGSGSAEQRWLDCHYGRAGEVTLSRKLDDRIRQCVITHFKEVQGEPRRIAIRCR